MEFTQEQLAILLEYAGRVITREEAAVRLGVTERQVNRYLRMSKIARAVSDSRTERTQAEKRRLAREQAAQAVLDGKINEKQAALRAGCHVRTIYRYLEKLK